MASSSAESASQRDVLIVSTTPLIVQVFRDMLASGGYHCLLAADGREAIEIFRGWRPPLVVADFNLQDMTAIELIGELREVDPDAAIVVVYGCMFKRGGQVIGFLDVERAVTAGLKLGAYAFLSKPVGLDELLAVAEGALASRRTAPKRHQPLEAQWAAVRPLASVSELLAVFAAVFETPRVVRHPTTTRNG